MTLGSADPKPRVPLSAFLLCVSGAWAVNLTFTLVAPILPQIAAAQGGAGSYSKEFATEVVTTVASLGIIIGMMASGWIQDRLGVRRTILLSLVFTGLAGSVGFFLPSIIPLGISRALLGFFGACSTTSITTLLAALFVDTTAKGRVLGYQQAVAGSFNIGATLLAGLVATSFGWPYVFLIYGVVALAVFAIALGGAADTRADVEAGAGSLLSAAASIWPLLLIVLGVLTMSVAPFTQGSFILLDAGVTDPGMRSLAISAGPVMHVVSAAVYGRLARYLGTSALITLGAATTAIGLGLIGLGETIGVIAAGIGLTGLGNGFATTAVLHRATEAAPHQRGRAIGLVHASIYLGVLLNPLVIAPLRAIFGLRQALTIWAVAALIVTIAFALARRFLAERNRAPA